jgi:sphinganine-1-phosphate aldolase
VVMYSSSALRAFQYFVAPEWTGGIYASPSMPGSRPGGLIAATWAALVRMGESGYMECAKEIMATAKEIEAGLRTIPGIRVLGKPDMAVVSFAADESVQVRGQTVNIYKVSESLTASRVVDGRTRPGWNLNTLQRPSSIHLCCTYMHRGRAAQFLADVRAAVDQVVDNPDMFRHGSAAIYGMAESIPDGSIIEDMAKGFIDTLYLTQ